MCKVQKHRYVCGHKWIVINLYSADAVAFLSSCAAKRPCPGVVAAPASSSITSRAVVTASDGSHETESWTGCAQSLPATVQRTRKSAHRPSPWSSILC